jgi:hypothetical protein
MVAGELLSIIAERVGKLTKRKAKQEQNTRANKPTDKAE